MGIWRIGPRFGLALVLLSVVCVAGTTRKAEPGQNGGLTQGGQTQGPQNGPPPKAQFLQAA
jgi:hypothetical protein